MGFHPLVMTNITMERSTMSNGYICYKWPFSIAMSNYQRVSKFSIHKWQSLGMGMVPIFPAFQNYESKPFAVQEWETKYVPIYSNTLYFIIL